MSTLSGTRSVHLVRERVLFVYGDCPELRQLQTAKHLPLWFRPRQTVPCYQEFESAKATDADPNQREFQFQLGMERAVIRLLERSGYAIEGPPPDPKLPPIDPSGLANLTLIDEPLLRMVRDHSRGLIRIDPAKVDPAWLIAQLALAWPEQTFAVVGASMARLREIAADLRRWLPPREVIIAKAGDHPEARDSEHPFALPWSVQGCVALCTYGALNAVHGYQRNVVIALDGLQSLGTDRLYWLSFCGQARTYALVELGARIAPYDADQLTMMYGFEYVSIPAHGEQSRPVTVAMCRMDAQLTGAGSLDCIELLRRGLWQHPMRNRVIVRLAKLLAARTKPELRAAFPTVAEALPRQWPRAIGIYTETLEHCMALARRLPGWDLVTAAGAEAPGLNKLQRDSAAGCGQSGFIATAGGLHQINFAEVDVLIRADGGTGPLAISIPTIRSAVMARRVPLTIVDFRDRHHAEFHRATRRRISGYRAAGWTVRGAKEPVDAIDQFLNSRPQETQHDVLANVPAAMD